MAASYARDLTRALQTRLGKQDSLIGFDGRRTEVVTVQNLKSDTEDMNGPRPLPFLYGSLGFVSNCLASFCADRAQAHYFREVDLSHSIGGAPPPYDNGGAPVIPLLADLSALSPRRESPETRQLERLLAQIHRYPMLTTSCDYTRRKLSALCGLDPARIAVIPPGVDESFYAPPSVEDEFELQALGLLPKQFFLHVGAFDERSNLQTLLDAYSGLPERVKAWLPLIVVSRYGRGARNGSCTMYMAGATPLRADEHDTDSGNIRVLDLTPRFLLRVLYRHARLTLFPSMADGFGLALAEALVCGAPVAVCRSSALSEMAGPLSVQIDPLDVIAWRQALADQVDRGAHAVSTPQKATFSWHRAAEKAMQVYGEMMHAGYATV
jgi:alpha-1,3-rhamnosyl/mannosyltransferase